MAYYIKDGTEIIDPQIINSMYEFIESPTPTNFTFYFIIEFLIFVTNAEMV